MSGPCEPHVGYGLCASNQEIKIFAQAHNNYHTFSLAVYKYVSCTRSHGLSKGTLFIA